MKKYLKIIIPVLVVIISLFIYISLRSDALKFRDDYMLYNFATYSNNKQIKVNIPTKNNVKYLKGNLVIPTLKKTTGIFYFGYNSCPWCRNVVETVVEVATENNLPLYYIDTQSLNNTDLKNIISYLNKYLRTSDSNEKRLYVPDVYFVKDGTIINHHIGSIENLKNPFNKLKGQDKANLKKIYLDFIKEMNEQ